MSVTLRDIARMAGVSPATVSLVLNGKAGVGDDTRADVLRIIKETGYKPSVKNQKGDSVALLKIPRHGHILNRDHNAFISDYIDGIEREARESGYSLEVINCPSLSPPQLSDLLDRPSLAGAVVLATELSREDYKLFESIRMPLVFLDGLDPSAPYDFIDMDNERAVHTVLGMIKERGYQKVGLVGSSAPTRNFRAREKYFEEAAEALAMEHRSRWQCVSDSTFDQACADILSYLERCTDLPDAFFCVCDIIANACLWALKKRGIAVPGEVSVVGFDNLPSSERSDPPLASVEVSKERMGRRAFQVLKRRIDGGSALPFEKVLIGTEFIDRESLGRRKDIPQEK